MTNICPLFFQQEKIPQAEKAIKILYGKEYEVIAYLSSAGQGSTDPDAHWFDLFSTRFWKGILISCLAKDSISCGLLFGKASYHGRVVLGYVQSSNRTKQDQINERKKKQIESVLVTLMEYFVGYAFSSF